MEQSQFWNVAQPVAGTGRTRVYGGTICSSDPESCLVKLRNYTELMVRWLYRRNDCLKASKANLYDLMNADVFTSMMPEAIIMKMDALRIHGNRAAHGGRIKS